MIFLSAFIASLFVPLTVLHPTSILLHPIGKLIISIVIILVGFGWKHPKKMVRLLLSFYFVSFTLGGALTAMHYFISNPVQLTTTGVITWNSGFGDPVSWTFVMVGFPIVWFFTKNSLDKHTLMNFQLDQMMEVSFRYNNKKVTTIGFVDSGNQLIDPITKKTIVVCDLFILKQLFSDTQIKLMKRAQESYQFDNLDMITAPLYMIPYHGVSGEPAFMLAFKPENFIIKNNSKQYRMSQVSIGVQFHNLASDGSYHCLLHPGMFNHATEKLA